MALVDFFTRLGFVDEALLGFDSLLGYGIKAKMNIIGYEFWLKIKWNKNRFNRNDKSKNGMRELT